ncbi:MAG: DUF6259 domain-containing protein [Armatimonadota bacterium]
MSKRSFIAILFTLIFCLAAGVATAAVPIPNGQAISLNNGMINISFTTTGDRLVLSGLSDADTNWIVPPAKDTSLWSLSFSGPGGATVDAISDEATLTAVSSTQNSAAFTWTVPLAKRRASIIARVSVKKDDPLSYWSLEAHLPKGWKAIRAAYPVIRGIRLDTATKMAVPRCWGMEYDMKPGVKYFASYPSASCSMQFISFYGQGKGLYIGNHDPAANHKDLSVIASEDGIVYRCTNWPEIPKYSIGGYKVPFETAIGVYNGDYYQAAQFYRDFSFTTKWGKNSEISKRPIPQWLKDIDLWFQPENDPVDNVELCKKAQDYFGVNTALQWYKWHVIPFDALYPDFFPAKKNFVDGVKTLQGIGDRVVPYINGRIVDPQSRAWINKHLDTETVKDAQGKMHFEYTRNSKRSLAVECPYAPLWQDEMAEIVDKLVNDCGVDGVYIDQIGAGYPYQCFDPTHGHPVGGGHFWVDGYRQMLEKIRKEMPKGKVLTTEENIECFIDQFDGLLMINSPSVGQRLIPLYPSVYSGRTILFGIQYIIDKDVEHSLPFRVKVAREFIWGSQLGWFGIKIIMTPEAAVEAEFLRNLAQCRKYGHEFFVTGRFLGEFNASTDNLHVEMNKNAGIDVPSVMGSKWRAEDGTYGIALVNISNEDHAVEVDFPIKTGGSYKLKTFGKDGLISETDTDSLTQKLTVPAKEALILSLSNK